MLVRRPQRRSRTRADHLKRAPMNDPISVTIRLSSQPSQYHILELRDGKSEDIIQISSECSAASVCEVAAAIKGVK